MLTADLVRARVKNGALALSPLKGKTKARAIEIAEAYLAAAAQPDIRRHELDAAFASVATGARERKLADGLKKLVLDRCEMQMEASIDPIELRRELFQRAATARQALEVGDSFDRAALLREVGAAHGLDEAGVESMLFADLRQEQRVVSFQSTNAEQLVGSYELAQEQAVLLKAEYVEVDLYASQPATYRYIFRKLKFLRLLHTIERIEGGYRVRIDGPYSLFSAVTKYGLQLALLLPALRACDRYELRSSLRWGRDRRRLSFDLAGGAGTPADDEAPPLPDEVATLLKRMHDRQGRWEVRPSAEILSLPGVGEIVPDLVCIDAERGVRIHLEVLGFWSREAVFRRIELVEQGLEQPLLFALPKRLRVREEIADEELPMALYVYKHSMSASAIETRLDALAERWLARTSGRVTRGDF